MPLGGRVSGAGVGGMTVALEQQRLGLDPGFTEVATGRTGSDGGYLFTIRTLWTTTSYRVVTKTQVVATSPVATARSRVTGRRPRAPRRAQAGAGRGLDLARRAGHGDAPALPVRARLADGRARDARPDRQTRSRYRFIVRRPKRFSRRFRVIGTPASDAHVRGTSRFVTVRPRPRRR